MDNKLNIRSASSVRNENFPTYTRAGRLRAGEYNGAPFSRVLASFRGTGEVPPEPFKSAPASDRPLINPTAPLEPLQQERPETLTVQTQHSKLDEVSRSALEDRVRQKKRLRERCPFTGFNGECCRPDIRCGERAQFSGRESDRQQTMPHRCLYTPYFSSDNVIIVENDFIQKEFLLNSFKLFLNYDMAKIASIPTAESAMETLTMYKLQNRMIGLVILNINSIGTGVHAFLTELFDRNINAEIILLTNDSPEEQAILKEFTARMTAPTVPFVSAVLQTPVHTEKFVTTVNDLHFGKFL